MAVKSALYATQIPSIKVATMDGDQPELGLNLYILLLFFIF
jgi:hypothetical protein